MNRFSIFKVAAFALVSVLFFSSCEDVIEVELEETDAVVVIDAWLDNTDGEQIIQVSRSQAYFDNSQPQGIENAEVKVARSDGEEFNFISQGEGYYKLESAAGILGVTQDEFTLSVLIEGVEYSATSKMNRVPVIDSIGLEFRDDELFSDDGLYANFYARDFQGPGDAYWIKTYANGNYLNKATELNLAYDAGFDSGTGVDGIIFITPIREFVNRLDDEGLVFPYVAGDVIRVEIHSISVKAFNFMEIVRDQINNGQNGIFSLPLANARTNISASDGSSAVGFFNVAGVSISERVVE